MMQACWGPSRSEASATSRQTRVAGEAHHDIKLWSEGPAETESSGRMCIAEKSDGEKLEHINGNGDGDGNKDGDGEGNGRTERSGGTEIAVCGFRVVFIDVTVLVRRHRQFRTMSQWIFEPQHLLCTPSSECDYTLKEELLERNRAIDFMFRVGLTLGLPLTPLYTAATYFHRFYMRHSFADYNWHESSMACLFLAAKIEETSRKLADTARMAMAKSRGLNPDRHNFSSPESVKELSVWAQNIQEREELLVETLCFDFIIRHPHSELCDLFNAWPDEQDADALDFLEAAAWTVANDAFRTPICVLAESNVAAYACFLVAGQAAGRHTVSDFLLLRDQVPVEQPSTADMARDILRVKPQDYEVVLACMILLRDYYAFMPEQTGRFAFMECLVSLPLPATGVEYYTPSVARTNGHLNGNGTYATGDHTPQSDGSKTPGALSVSALSQGTADSN